MSTPRAMKILDKYLALQAAIFAYFGYVEDWRAIPIDDRREMFWHITNGEGADSEVLYSPDVTFPDAMTYCDVIYTQRFLPKWVYRGPEFTMICVDTQTDGNKFLAIYDNAKEVFATPTGAQADAADRGTE